MLGRGEEEGGPERQVLFDQGEVLGRGGREGLHGDARRVRVRVTRARPRRSIDQQVAEHARTVARHKLAHLDGPLQLQAPPQQHRPLLLFFLAAWLHLWLLCVWLCV